MPKNKNHAPLLFSRKSKRAEQISKHRNCNICGSRFYAPSRFMRYCKKCKVESELYRFSETVLANGLGGEAEAA